MTLLYAFSADFCYRVNCFSTPETHAEHVSTCKFGCLCGGCIENSTLTKIIGDGCFRYLQILVCASARACITQRKGILCLIIYVTYFLPNMDVDSIKYE